MRRKESDTQDYRWIDKHKLKKKASEQDKRVSEATNFRIRPNSGAMKGAKGDLGGPDIFVETKTRMTIKDHLLLEMKWIDKARSQAFSMGKPLYVLVISAGDDQDYVVASQPNLLTNSFDPDFQFLIPDLTMSSKSQLKIDLSLIDRSIYKRRKNGVEPPCFRLYFNDGGLGLIIMYLDDFMDYYKARPSDI